MILIYAVALVVGASGMTEAGHMFESVSTAYIRNMNMASDLTTTAAQNKEYDHVQRVFLKAERLLSDSIVQLQRHAEDIAMSVASGKVVKLENLSDFPVDNCTTRTLAFVAEYAADCALKNGNLTLACLEPLLIAGLQIFDATGKIPAGISQGSHNWFGDYDSCRAVNVAPVGALERDPLTMKSCILQDTIGTPPKVMAFNVEACAPAFCSAVEVVQVYSTALQALGQLGEYVDTKYNITIVSELYLLLDIEFHVVGAECQEVEKPYAKVTVAALCVGTCFAILVVIATIYDICWFQLVDEPLHAQKETDSDYADLIPRKAATPGTLQRCLLAFSAYTNGSKLLSTDVPKDDYLGCLHGIRLISIMWVALGHGYTTTLSLVDNPNMLQSYLDRFTFQFVVNGTFSVDTFFVLSGTLVAYLTIGQLDKLKSVSATIKFWAIFYFHRFWRLTPVYMMIIFFYVGVFPIWGSGPIWPQEPDHDCVDNWWTNLLYVNNLVRSKDMCMGWTWYLANDMQFYWLSPLVLYAFWRKQLLGWLLTGLAVAVHFTTQFAFTYHNKQSAGMVVSCPNATQPTLGYGNDTYFKPWTRVGPYAIGLALGYLLQKSRGKWKMPWMVHLCGWAVGIILGMLVIYGLYPVLDCSYTLPQAIHSLYLASSRLMWSLVVSALIWSCAHHDTPINRLLSWSALRPLSRLTYTVYLVHIIVYSTFTMATRRGLHLYDIDQVWMYTSMLWFSFGLAAIFSIVFEAPAMALEKIFLPRGK